MNEVILDLTNINSKVEFHNLIRKTFKFEIYTDNLDSLWDNLSTYYQPLLIKVIKNKEENPIKDYLNVFYETLEELTLENKFLKIEFI